MPNDTRNTRIDIRVSDNDSFSDFVRYGSSADSVNRFEDTTMPLVEVPPPRGAWVSAMHAR